MYTTELFNSNKTLLTLFCFTLTLNEENSCWNSTQPVSLKNPIALPYLLERRSLSPNTSSQTVTVRGRRRIVYIKPQSQDMIYEHGGGEEAANEHTHDRFVDSHNTNGLSLIKYSRGQKAYITRDKGNIVEGRWNYSYCRNF